MLTFREELSSDAETIMRRIDAQLSKIEADLRSLPIPEVCNVQEQTALARHVFKSVGIRGLVIADTASSGPKYCSNFGTQERLIDGAFWQAKQVEDVIFARLQVTEHRRDLSFALAVYRDDKIVIGTINPRVVLGWWIEPYDNDARVTMSFPDSDMPLLDRNQSEFAGKELSTSLVSSRYPIEIEVTKTMGLLTTRIETFFVRLSVFGLMVFGLVFVIDVYTRLNSEEKSYERL